MHDTEHRDYPTCPHCGTEEEDWTELSGLNRDGDSVLAECCSCGRSYSVTIYVTPTFSTGLASDFIRHEIRALDDVVKAWAGILNAEELERIEWGKGQERLMLCRDLAEQLAAERKTEVHRG
jgi:hypothetical protein